MNDTTTAPVPRWINWAAHAVPLTVLPSGLWRLALGIGIPVGFTGELGRMFHAPDWKLTPYVIVLSLVAEGLALLTLGLVRPWGETVPTWLPPIGGRRIPTLAAVIPATLGAIVVTLFCVQSAFLWSGPENMGDPDAPQGTAAWVMGACYAPLIAWGPLLLVVTIAYYRRRRRQERGSTRADIDVRRGVPTVPSRSPSTANAFTLPDRSYAT